MGDILKWKEVKTRKPHKCWGCDEEHPKGSKMISSTYVDGGEIHSSYWCATCVKYMDKYWESDDECGEGDIKANDLEGWMEIKLNITINYLSLADKIIR